MNKLFTSAVVAMTCMVGAYAADVDIRAAEKFRIDLRRSVDQNASNLEQPENRRAHGVALGELVRRSEKLFGDVLAPKFGACVKAAMMLQHGWASQIRMISEGTPRDIGQHTRMTFDAGVEYWACRIAIDSLSPARPVSDECLVRFDLSKPNGGELPRPAHCKKLAP